MKCPQETQVQLPTYPCTTSEETMTMMSCAHVHFKINEDLGLHQVLPEVPSNTPAGFEADPMSGCGKKNRQIYQ